MLGRLLAFFRRNRLDRELDDEVGFHLDMLESEFRAKDSAPRKPGWRPAASSERSSR